MKKCKRTVSALKTRRIQSKIKDLELSAINHVSLPQETGAQALKGRRDFTGYSEMDFQRP